MRPLEEFANKVSVSAIVQIKQGIEHGYALAEELLEAFLKAPSVNKQIMIDCVFDEMAKHGLLAGCDVVFAPNNQNNCMHSELHKSGVVMTISKRILA